MDYFAKTITLSMPDIPPVVWKKAVRCKPTGIISYVCSRILISRGSESYLTYICDTCVESLTFDFVPIVCKFPNVLPDDLPGIPLTVRLSFLLIMSLEPDLFLWHPTIWLLPSLRI